MNINDIIRGGLADNKSLDDIAKHHDCTLSEIVSEFEMGLKVEMEHTDSVKIATEIAKDHLWEDKNYYSKLSKIESNG